MKKIKFLFLGSVFLVFMKLTTLTAQNFFTGSDLTKIETSIQFNEEASDYIKIRAIKTKGVEIKNIHISKAVKFDLFYGDIFGGGYTKKKRLEPGEKKFFPRETAGIYSGYLIMSTKNCKFE